MAEQFDSLFSDNSQSTNNSNTNGFKSSFDKQGKTLESIESLLSDLVKTMSQSQAQNLRDDIRDNRNSNRLFQSDAFNRTSRSKSKNGGFLEGVEESFSEAFGGEEFKRQLRGIASVVADQAGISMEELPKALGKEMADSIQKTKLGGGISKIFNSWKDKALNSFKDQFAENYAKYTGQSADGIKDAINKFQQDLGLDNRFGKANDGIEVKGINELISSSKLQEGHLKDLIDALNQQEYPGQEFKDALESNISSDESTKSTSSSGPDIGDVIDSVSDKFDSEKIGKLKQKLQDFSNSSFNDLFEGFKNSKIGGTAVGKKVASVGSKIAGTAANTAGKVLGEQAVGAGIRAAGSAALGTAGGPVGIAVMIGIEAITDFLGDIFGAFTKLMDGLGKAADRDMTSRQKMIELGNKRLQADTETIIKKPFETLQRAAEKVEQVWDENLRLINQTQGYSKEDLQSLIGNYSNRLRTEGLDAVIDSASITENLSNVLKSGLSGKVAEEFAYEATKLNAAIPTQDFFTYANTYSSLAANAIKMGYSQEEAIKYANQQLEVFASNILYASRQISGGFSAGLQDAQGIFQQAVQISQAGRTNNPAVLGGTLASISALVGAVAPDLGSQIVEAVYKAAVGGNASDIVALRSLAGINASNTEFLQAVINNPQTIFSNLFNRLAQMQNMSPTNYMEVAEGLESTFGISKEALSRVDFAYLSQAIDQMQIGSDSLQANLALLQSGQSTLSAEQMKIRQINEYMINEGLSYVLDNEAAREVQQHMWDEQIAQELMENEYAIDLRGESLTFLNDIVNAVRNILGFLNPITNIMKAINLAQTAIEAATADDRVRQVLEAGKIGQGNQKVLQNLTTYGQQLKLTNSYLSQLQQARSGSAQGYQWAVVGKSMAASLGTAQRGTSAYSPITEQYATSQNINLNQMQVNFDRMLDTMSNFMGRNLQNQVDQMLEDREKTLKNSIKISQFEIEKLAKEYEENPGAYGMGDIYNISTINNELGKQMARTRAEIELRRQKEIEAEQQAKIDIQNEIERKQKNGEFLGGYSQWASTASKFGISDFSETIKELGYTESSLQQYFENLETQEGAKSEYQRRLDEETFWKQTQELLNTLNINVHDVFDKSDVMGVFWPDVHFYLDEINYKRLQEEIYTDALNNKIYTDALNNKIYTDALVTRINDTALESHIYKDALMDHIYPELKSFHTEMLTNFIKLAGDYHAVNFEHVNYNRALGNFDNDDNHTLAYAQKLLQGAEDKSAEDKINALAQALVTTPLADLLDPTVQTNVFLAQILRTVQGIFQQNNTQGKLKLPDAIAALATGMEPTTL